MKKLVFLLLSLVLLTSVKADEGMWMLPLIKKLNIQTMKGMGCTMTADQIYSDKNVSLKDAVVIFGGGCTGVMVSPNGLVFTNHHCGYDAIQQHSTVEHNYLKDGFTAKELKDEIPTPGLAVTFLVKVEDVTGKVIPKLANLSGKQRKFVQDSICKIIENENGNGNGNHYHAQVRSFYDGNEYYLFVYQTFRDVRFAYAPPSSIGKFGGETDNWMYPRHTGDFSVFRVYCAPDGTPADYSPQNVPYNPKRFVPISNRGYKEGDFAMILGNPGSTDRYATSYAIASRVKNGNSARAEMRGIKQDVWLKYMRADEAINIAYASKFASSANYWKNSIGMNKAIKHLNVITEKQKEEAEFTNWVNKDKERIKKYGNVLENLKTDYGSIDKNQHAIEYLRESLLGGVELPRIANSVNNQLKQQNASADTVLEKTAHYYKNYYPEVDKAAFVALLEGYKKSVTADELPEVYKTIQNNYNGDYTKYVENLFNNSAFVSPEKLKETMLKGNYDFANDPALSFYDSVTKKMDELRNNQYNSSLQNIIDNERIYQAGLLEWSASKNKPMHPDANFTMRLTYGQIKGYKPADGADYRYYTTTQGILEKEDPENPEFVVPEKLKQAIETKNFGNYVDKKDGTMHVAYTTTNDITGGNSGSPVFNGKGELIGLAFDGNWESLSGDIIFEPNLQRCIAVDIRYVLFVMEKVGGADRLIKELTIK